MGNLHLGYAAAAVGYMIGIFFLATAPEQPGGGGLGAPLIWNLLHIPLFAGLASCLLLSVSDGRWSRPLPGRLYGAVVAIAGAYAAFDEWHQSFVPGRYGTVRDFLLNCVGIVTLVLVHRLVVGREARVMKSPMSSVPNPTSLESPR